jgi:phospholipid-binding lipoprotein MlaA
MGMGGLFDVGAAMNLPKHQEDFGQTLAVWGVPSGPYLVLPIYGPNSPRDTLGLIGDAMFNPLTYVSIFGNSDATYSTMGARFVEVIDKRAQLLSTEKVVNEASGQDRYEFMKNAYQQRRDYLIKDGNTDASDLDKELDSLDSDKPAEQKP